MKRAIVYACMSMLPVALKAQVGIGTATPHASAQLEISATNKGLLIPRILYANRPASPATGLLIYQTDNTPGYYFYNGSSWQQLGGDDTWSLNGNTGNSAGHFIGTIDSKPFVVKVGNIRSGYITNEWTSGLTFWGWGAGLNHSTGAYNTGIGYGAMVTTTTGSYNTAVGYRSLYYNTDGARNTALGSYTLQANTIGWDNVAIGMQSLSDNTDGSENTAVGVYTLNHNTTGVGNTSVGKSSLSVNSTGQNNTSVGAYAMFVSNIGNRNTAVGYQALTMNDDGSNNTALGYAALSINTTGSFNTALGYNAGPNTSGLTNTTAVGNGARATANDMVRIGNAAVTQIGGAVGWSVLSDVRFKTHIQPQVHGLDFIMRLQPITYHIDVRKLSHFLNDDKADSIYASVPAGRKENILYSGFSAQQVEAAAAAVQYDFSGIHKPESEKDHYSLEYAEFVVPLVKAVQEQQQLIEQLKESNEQLKKEMMEYRQWREELLKQWQQTPVRAEKK